MLSLSPTGLEGATVSFAMKTFNVKQGGNVSWSVNVGNYATAADIQIVKRLANDNSEYTKMNCYFIFILFSMYRPSRN